MGLSLVLAVGYSIVVPIGRGADEWAHFWYAQFISANQRLPLDPAEREAAGYKSDWPPLYHLLAAGLTGWIETAGPPTLKYREANIRRQLVPSFGPEAIIHTRDERFPWRQEILVWHLGRLLSIGFAAGTLVVTYFIAVDVFQVVNRRAGPLNVTAARNAAQKPLFYDPRFLALITVTLLAFNPRFLFTGMLFSYDSLTLLVASLFLWLALRVAQGDYPRWGFWGLGAVAGLSLVTKYLAALLPLVIIAVVFIVSRTRSSDEPASAQLIRWGLIRLGQAALAFLLVISGWFGYLLINFNEIGRYGPVVGVLAPLLRGDGSDRTVEALFAFVSGDRAAEPAYIERQSYTAWQIIRELPLTFWGNPISEPYPLTWFVLVMTLLGAVAAAGLVRAWLNSGSGSPGPSRLSEARLLLLLLLLFCALPLPFMIIRLFGARDALEAVQGRHILFLTGPAFAILMVWGLDVVAGTVFRFITSRANSSLKRLLDFRRPLARFPFYVLLALLLAASIQQLIWMSQIYPPLAPVQTTAYHSTRELPVDVGLAGGAELIDVNLTDTGSVLELSLVWQAGPEPSPEDYQVGLALVDEQGQIQSSWVAYQTQARYPTRVWENGDIVYDVGWLPTAGLVEGDYEIWLRLGGDTGETLPWHRLTRYTLTGRSNSTGGENRWHMWRDGTIMSHPPTLRERETVQFTLTPPASAPDESDTPTVAGGLPLIAPNGASIQPAESGPTWANFIIGPDWPAGDYRTPGTQQVAFRVAGNNRSFEVPEEMTHSLEANFQGQIKLLGYRLPNRRVQPGDGLPITLYWQGLEWMGEEFVIFIRLLDNQQAAWGGYDRLAKENYSTLLWAPGEIVTDGFAVPVSADAPDGVYTLSLGWYRQVRGEAVSLPVLDPETDEPTGGTAVTIGPIKVGNPPPGVTVTEFDPQIELNVTLGEQIKLVGFDQDTTERHSDSSAATPPAHFILYWQTLTPPDVDYTIFAHLRDSSGEIVAQTDKLPVDGRYPTSLWESGEVIKDAVSLPIDRLEPGAYELVVGMYDFGTGSRLPVEDSPDETILLQSFEVGP